LKKARFASHRNYRTPFALMLMKKPITCRFL
jgi:hypothetical protein